MIAAPFLVVVVAALRMCLLPERTHERARVGIIGAGASGLRCAQTLVQEQGFAPSDLVLLEGRDRIGGRIYTTHETRTTADFSKRSFPLDHGAAWVHGTGYDWKVPLHSKPSLPLDNPMMDLLAQTTNDVYDCLTPVVHGNPWMRPGSILHRDGALAVFVQGHKLEADSPLIPAALQRHHNRMKAVAALGNDLLDQGLGMETVTQSFGQAMRQVEGTSSNDAVENLTGFYLHLVECWYGKESDDLQISPFLGAYGEEEAQYDEEYTEEGDFYGPHCTVATGMESILQPLLRNGVSDRIRLNEEVVRICREADSTIRIESASGKVTVVDQCVITIPAGPLKKAVESQTFFDPPLSEDKQEAVGQMKMGCYKKVFLTFDKIFWPTQEAFVGLIGSDRTNDTLGKYLLIDNLWAKNGIPCMEAILFGPAGRWAIGKTDDVIRDEVLKFLADTMGTTEDLQASCQDCHVTRWEEDRFSLGAYSSLSLGALIRHVEELARPEWDGNLIFAGEATILEHEGSVHAALFSGEQAAKHVCAANKVLAASS